MPLNKQVTLTFKSADAKAWFLSCVADSMKKMKETGNGQLNGCMAGITWSSLGAVTEVDSHGLSDADAKAIRQGSYIPKKD